MFYCDIAASVVLEASKRAIAHLEEIAIFVRILGSFASDGVLIGEVTSDISSSSLPPPLKSLISKNLSSKPLIKIGILSVT